MTKQELKKFVFDLLNAWQYRDAEKVSSMYSKAVIAHMDNNSVGYDDIMNRMEFSKSSFIRVVNDLQDIIIDGEKVVARIEQTCESQDKTDVYKIIAIYHIRDYKIIEMWSSFYPNVNYLKNNIE